MNLKEIQKEKSSDIQEATWCFILNGNKEILLAMKKRGFGEGFWNVSGGKLKLGEERSVAAAREVYEEVGISVSDLRQVAEVEFYFLNKPEWGQRVIGFIADEWTGEPKETDEMAPKWFHYEDIPYDQMWADDRIWLPMVLEGKKIEGEFLFGDNNDILEYNIREITD